MGDDRAPQARGLAHWLLGVQPCRVLLHAHLWLAARGHRHPRGTDALVLCVCPQPRLQGGLAQDSAAAAHRALLRARHRFDIHRHQRSAPRGPLRPQPPHTAVAHALRHLRPAHLPLALRLPGGLFRQAPRVMPAPSILAHQRGGRLPYPGLRHHPPRPHPNARPKHLNPNLLQKPLRRLEILKECVIQKEKMTTTPVVATLF